MTNNPMFECPKVICSLCRWYIRRHSTARDIGLPRDHFTTAATKNAHLLPYSVQRHQTSCLPGVELSTVTARRASASGALRAPRISTYSSTMSRMNRRAPGRNHAPANRFSHSSSRFFSFLSRRRPRNGCDWAADDTDLPQISRVLPRVKRARENHHNASITHIEHRQLTACGISGAEARSACRLSFIDGAERLSSELVCHPKSIPGMTPLAAGGRRREPRETDTRGNLLTGQHR